MLQPIYLISRTSASSIVESQGRKHSGLNFGAAEPAQIIHALAALPVQAEPDLIDLTQTVQLLQQGHTTKMGGLCNRGLEQAERACKAARVSAPS
jgi:hypothetical protein